ncbi:MAG: sulfate reduction electron transfer complex DsrMKJOP subunit DsrP [Planctomycetota bacterium]|jgi:molybdopterin-containing oxidoreductase family membrane subunit
MLEHVTKGSKRYWGLLGFLGFIILVGLISYSRQWNVGLGITGMSRDVTWGLYIAQFTFLVGVAASAVMVVLPYYLHDFKAFGKMVILGEFLAVSAVSMCVLFILVDLGQPLNMFNMIEYPTPNAIMFWDGVVLSSYAFVNLVIGFTTLHAEYKGTPPPRWVKPLIIFSIPLAVSIHTVTAFLFSGLAAKTFWMTAILAPRFLASAFASGPGLLILFALLLRKYTRFDPGKAAIQKLGTIVTYALAVNIFFLVAELFTVFYSDIPHHTHTFEYMFAGYGGKSALVPWMWLSVILNVGSLIFLLFPHIRAQEKWLAWLCGAVITGIWIEKGLGMIISGFIPSALGDVTQYTPTMLEILITLGVYGIGFFILTVLYKIAIGVREAKEPAAQKSS